MSVDLTFELELTDSLEPTLEDDGKTYVVQNGVVVVANPQPAEEKRIGDSANISCTHIYYHDTTTAITAEDARSLAGVRYDIKLRGGNGNPGIRIASAPVDKDASATVFNAVVNNASGVSVGILTFDNTNPEDASKVSFRNVADSADGLTTFYYSYNPQYAVAEGSEQASSETAGSGKSVSVTVTLTAHA